MATKKATPEMVRSLVIEAERAVKDGLIEPDRKTWATAQLGQVIGTFNQLTAWQAGFLMDLLRSKRPRIYFEIEALMQKCYIFEPDAWLNTVLARWYSGKDVTSSSYDEETRKRVWLLSTLNAREAVHVREVLKRRIRRG